MAELDSITIRLATGSDLDAIRALLVARMLWDEPPVDFSQPVLVAEVQGQCVGVIHALLGHPISVLTDLAVSVGWEHRGVAQQLVAALEELMRNAGYTEYVALVHPDNTRTIEFALKHGARDCGTVRAFRRSLE